MNNHFARLVQYLMLSLDIVSMNALVLLTSNKPEIRENTTSFIGFLLAANVGWIVISWMSRLYGRKRLTAFESLLRCTTRSYFCWIVLVIACLYFARLYDESRIYAAIVLVGYGVIVYSNRILYFAVRHCLKQSKSLVRPVIILGFNEQAKKLASYL